MSDNIQVAIRVRQLNQKEIHESQGRKCIQVNKNQESLSITVNSNSKTFAYDYVGDQEVSQEELYEKIGKPIALSCLTGYNGSIFAYGQTGAGKTYTIMGSLSESYFNFDNRGILPRCLEFIFSTIKREIKKNIGIEYLIKCSFLEIYNEQINDLISPEIRNLQIREDMKKGAYVENLHQATVVSFDETFEFLEKGIKYRHIGSTSMNKESSRSHSVFTLQIESKEKRDDIWNFKNSFFHLIDLAGSERQKLTEAYGERLKEAGMINKSLSSLGNVINSLVELSEGRSRHVPYRDSKLTFLLKDSLGGNSKTCIIANISPAYTCYGETLSTLRFAERAKLVKNKAIINEDTMGTISELKEEVKRLKSLLKNNNQSASFFSTDFSERIKNVESLLEQNLRIRLQSEASLNQEIETRERYIETLNMALEKCEKKILSDKKTIKTKNEALKKYQKNETLTEDKIIFDLRQEVEILRRENENHPAVAKISAENCLLKNKINELENELRESSSSMTARLKESQDFTEKLQVALRKGANEREQLHILLDEYLKKAKNDNNPGKELQLAKKQISDLQKLLEKEKNKVTSLEEQLTIVNESQGTEDYPNTSRESKYSTVNSSEFLPIQETERQNELFQRFLEENEKIGRENEKIKELEEKILVLENENKALRKYETENFKYEEENERLADDIMRKENKIEELQNEIETIIAENEFLSTQFIEFGQQLTQKEKKITELTEKLSSRPNKSQIEENLKLKSEIEEINQKYSANLTEYQSMKEEIQLSVNSREQILDELKRLQSEKISLHNECQELNSKLHNIEQDNEKLKDNLCDLNSEIISVSGQNNLNQKIKLHAKMKEENNKLKEQNYQLREDLRKKTGKIENLEKKIEIFLKGSSSKEIFHINDNGREKIEELEKAVNEKNAILEEINNTVFSLPFVNELPGDRIQDKLIGALEFLNQEVQIKQDKIEALGQEISLKDTNLKILENESLLLKQKVNLNKNNI